MLVDPVLEREESLGRADLEAWVTAGVDVRAGFSLVRDVDLGESARAV